MTIMIAATMTILTRFVTMVLVRAVVISMSYIKNKKIIGVFYMGMQMLTKLYHAASEVLTMAYMARKEGPHPGKLPQPERWLACLLVVAGAQNLKGSADVASATTDCRVSD